MSATLKLCTALRELARTIRKPNEGILMDRAATAELLENVASVIEDMSSSVVAFAAPWAVEYARQRGLPPGQLHPTHYDILAKAGARMDDFTRAPEEPA